MLRDRDAFLEEVRKRLLQAQQYAKRHYDEHHREVEFDVGAWVLLRLVIGSSLSSGRVSQKMMRRGSLSRTLRPSTPMSSSRTSCLPKQGEML